MTPLDTIPVVKTSRSVLQQTLLFVLFFGLLTGLIFPFFSLFLLDVHAEKVLTAKYFFACVMAGLLLAAASQLLVQFTIMREISRFKQHLQHVTGNIREYKQGQLDLDGCTDCYMEVSSNDALGEIQVGMNELIHSIRNSFSNHELTDSYHQLLNQALDMQQLSDATVRYFTENFERVIAAEIFVNSESGLKLISSQYMHRDIPAGYLDFLHDVIDSGEVHRSSEGLVLTNSGVCSEGVRGHLVFPIRNSREQLGALVLYLSGTMDSDAVRHISRLLGQYQLAYANAAAYSQIKGMATYDDLTAVYNRQHGMQLIAKEFARCRDASEPISVIMIDLDHFKQLNDTFGHPAGDMVLRNVAALFAESVRGRDIVVRYGGEEFVIIMPQMRRHDAGARMEGILEKLNSMVFPWSQLSIAVTFSAGISSSEDRLLSDYSLALALQQADSALYRAKKQGRNQVVVATE